MREDRMISLHQIPFIEKAYEKFMPKDRTPVDIPAFHDRKNPRHYSKFISPPSDSERKSMQNVPFLGLYATLLFGMTMTLPSISYNMSFTGQFMQDPSPDQYECLLDILSFCYVNRKQNVLRYQMLEMNILKDEVKFDKCSFPCYVMSLTNLCDLDKIPSHEDAYQAGLLEKLTLTSRVPTRHHR